MSLYTRLHPLEGEVSAAKLAVDEPVVPECPDCGRLVFDVEHIVAGVPVCCGCYSLLAGPAGHFVVAEPRSCGCGDCPVCCS